MVCFDTEVSAPSVPSAVEASLRATGCARPGTTSTTWRALPATRARGSSAQAKSSPCTRTGCCARRTTSRYWTGAARRRMVSPTFMMLTDIAAVLAVQCTSRYEKLVVHCQFTGQPIYKSTSP